MSTNTTVSGSASSAAAPLPTDTALEKLPRDLSDLILPYLDDLSLCALANTSRSMNGTTLEATGKSASCELKEFIRALLSRTSDGVSEEERITLTEKQKDDLATIDLQLGGEVFPNLISIKKYILLRKAKLIDILATLSAEDLKTLETSTTPGAKNAISLPRFCKNIFTIVKICKELEVAHDTDLPHNLANALDNIAIALVEAKEFDRAIELAVSHELGPYEYAVHKLVDALVEAREFDKTISLLGRLSPSDPDYYWPYQVLEKIFDVLKEPELERAIGTLRNVQGDLFRARACKILVTREKFDAARRVAMSIRQLSTRNDILGEINELCPPASSCVCC